jgi:tumor protein p53-inducible protein 3
MEQLPASMFVAQPRDKEVFITAQPVPAPSPTQLLLRVAWSAVNRADTLQRRGLYPAPPGAPEWLGLEAVGVVIARGGGGASAGGAPALGARVMALLPGGGNAEFVAVEHSHVLPVPPSLTLRDAAAIPETWLTAFQLLFLVGAQLNAAAGGGLPSLAGSTVVVHAAGSGVGTAAVQLAAAAGARVVAVAGSEEKLAAAARLGAAEGVNYKAEPASFGARLAAAAARGGGGGAALILDPVGAPFAAANVEALAPDGAWVLFGSLGGLKLSESPAAADALLGALLRKRGRLVGTTLRNRSDEYKANLVARFRDEALPLLESGALRGVVHAEFPLDRTGEAHALMESNATLGKILLRVSGEL